MLTDPTSDDSTLDFPFDTTPRRYPSDVTSRQWIAISQRLPPDVPRGRRRSVELRAVVNAINYRWHTGCSWRMLPRDFPAWETVYGYFNSWHRLGILRDMRTILLQPRRDRCNPRRPAEAPPGQSSASRDPSDRPAASTPSPPADRCNPNISNDAQ